MQCCCCCCWHCRLCCLRTCALTARLQVHYGVGMAGMSLSTNLMPKVLLPCLFAVLRLRVVCSAVHACGRFTSIDWSLVAGARVVPARRAHLRAVGSRCCEFHTHDDSGTWVACVCCGVSDCPGVSSSRAPLATWSTNRGSCRSSGELVVTIPQHNAGFRQQKRPPLLHSFHLEISIMNKRTSPIALKKFHIKFSDASSSLLLLLLLLSPSPSLP